MSRIAKMYSRYNSKCARNESHVQKLLDQWYSVYTDMLPDANLGCTEEFLFQTFLCNFPRIIYFEFKTDRDRHFCILSSGTAQPNACFNIILDKVIGIMCFNNDIYSYPTKYKSLTDNELHSGIVILGINVIHICVDNEIVFNKTVSWCKYTE